MPFLDAIAKINTARDVYTRESSFALTFVIIVLIRRRRRRRLHPSSSLSSLSDKSSRNFHCYRAHVLLGQKTRPAQGGRDTTDLCLIAISTLSYFIAHPTNNNSHPLISPNLPDHFRVLQLSALSQFFEKINTVCILDPSSSSSSSASNKRLLYPHMRNQKEKDSLAR